MSKERDSWLLMYGVPKEYLGYWKGYYETFWRYVVTEKQNKPRDG